MYKVTRENKALMTLYYMISMQRVGLQLGGWAWGYQPFTAKNKPVTKIRNEAWI
jgi:hypothetical protein